MLIHNKNLDLGLLAAPKCGTSENVGHIFYVICT